MPFILVHYARAHTHTHSVFRFNAIKLAGECFKAFSASIFSARLPRFLQPDTFFPPTAFFRAFSHLSRRSLGLPFTDASQTLAGILWHIPFFRLLIPLFLSSPASRSPEQAFVELLMERFRALPRLSGASFFLYLFPSSSRHHRRRSGPNFSRSKASLRAVRQLLPY